MREILSHLPLRNINLYFQYICDSFGEDFLRKVRGFTFLPSYNEPDSLRLSGATFSFCNKVVYISLNYHNGGKDKTLKMINIIDSTFWVIIIIIIIINIGIYRAKRRLSIPMEENPGKTQLGYRLLKAVRPFIASNGVLCLQMWSIGSHSTPGRKNVFIYGPFNNIIQLRLGSPPGIILRAIFLDYNGRWEGETISTPLPCFCTPFKRN